MASPMRQRLNAGASTNPVPLQKRQTMVIGRQPLSMVQARAQTLTFFPDSQDLYACSFSP
jgi:hypothetical protein